MVEFPFPPGTFFVPDPNDPPVPPDQVRVRRVQVEPWSDGRRVKVVAELTPFEKRPHVEIEVFNEQGQVVAGLSVVEPIDPRLEFTLHLRDPYPEQRFRLVVSVQYPDPDYKPQAPEEGEEWQFPEMHEVHRYEHTFTLHSEPDPFDFGEA